MQRFRVVIRKNRLELRRGPDVNRDLSIFCILYSSYVIKMKSTYVLTSMRK